MGDLEMTNTTTKSSVQAVYWQAITPVHSGTGQTSASVIDLPIAREKATHYPVLPASSIKGVLRNGEGLKKEERDSITEGDKVFGYVNKKTGKLDEQGNEVRESRASDLTFTDARLLCLPVRSYAGTFAYVTCPHILKRLDRDREALGLAKLFGMALTVKDTAASVCPDSALVHSSKVLFEDIDLEAANSAEAQKIAQAIASAAGLSDDFAARFAIVSDDIFAYFSETATEVSAHVSLKSDTKTVDKEKGGLWYEEAIPAEALFASFVISAAGQFEALSRPFIQLGGKGSVGKGLLKITVEGGV